MFWFCTACSIAIQNSSQQIYQNSSHKHEEQQKQLQNKLFYTLLGIGHITFVFHLKGPMIFGGPGAAAPSTPRLICLWVGSAWKDEKIVFVMKKMCLGVIIL